MKRLMIFYLIFAAIAKKKLLMNNMKTKYLIIWNLKVIIYKQQKVLIIPDYHFIYY